jgi:hypothetical protein
MVDHSLLPMTIRTAFAGASNAEWRKLFAFESKFNDKRLANEMISKLLTFDNKPSFFTLRPFNRVHYDATLTHIGVAIASLSDQLEIIKEVTLPLSTTTDIDLAEADAIYRGIQKLFTTDSKENYTSPQVESWLS